MYGIINTDNKIIFNNIFKRKRKIGRDDGYVLKNALYFYCKNVHKSQRTNHENMKR